MNTGAIHVTYTCVIQLFYISNIPNNTTHVFIIDVVVQLVMYHKSIVHET